MISQDADRPFALVYPPAGGLTVAAYPGAAGLPVIFDRRPGVHRLGLRFLLDVAYAKWRFPGGFHEKAGARRPSQKSMRSIAERLANYLDWADTRHVDLHVCGYSESVMRYQREMLDGIWSRSGKALEESTVNVRVDVAVHYMRWLVDIGEKTTFTVLTKTVSLSYGSYDNAHRNSREIVTREGRLRKRQRLLTLPTKDSVRSWLLSAKEHNGSTFELMARTILLTGIRRAEVISLRVDSIPTDASSWEIVNPTQPEHLQEVSVKLEWGAKGPTLETCDSSHDERKAGRYIRIPLTLAKGWDQYRTRDRIKAVGKRLAGLKGKERERIASSLVHLFLREDDGKRWSDKAFYDAWVATPIEASGKWHPHKGRHWWACMTLWDEMRRLQAAEQSKENIMSVITTRIQPQLGHASQETTMLYLKWAMNQLGTPLVLDEGDQESECAVNDDDEYED